MEEIYFNTEGKEKLIEGINKANKAVASTMGPNGTTVIIPNSKSYNTYKVTKDGVSVINSIKLKDPIENIGAELLRQAANKTVEEAGDGTTTATVLATAFVNNLKDFNTVDINKAFDEIIPKVLEQLKLNSRELKREDIKYVASISANNDIQIGDTIQSAFNHSDIVKIEESKSTEDYLELVSGMKLDITSFSKNFLTELVNPTFLLLEGKLDKLDNFKSQIEAAQNPDTPLVIMCEDIHDSVLHKLEAYVLSGNLYLTVIKTPGFGSFRRDLISDLAIFIDGTPIITKITPNINVGGYVGKLESVKITPNYTILVKHDDVDISQRILSLEELKNQIDIEEHQKDLLQKRIEYLRSEISIIKVGGQTELEMKERYDRYDDAVKAVTCALEEGVVEGGGIALHSIQQILYENYLDDKSIEDNILRSLDSPRLRIGWNGNIRKDYSKSMFEQNIIDPLKVTRCALENAVSVAKTILSTEAIVLHELSWNQN